MLKIKNLNKYYKNYKSNKEHALKNINLEFSEKGFYFLLGPNGSGKSTLLNCLGLLDSFDSGSIEIDDKTITKYRNVDDIRNKYFGYIFQNYLLDETLTVYENLDIVLKLIGYKGDHYKRIEEVLKILGMEKYIKRNASDLSGGQKQRIGIARCLIKSPKIILMDEPTGNLDEKNAISVMEIASKLSENCLIICVSHDEALASAYADTIIRIKDGSIIEEVKNNNKKHLSSIDKNNIYLKDYKVKSINNINVYSNTDLPKLDIVVANNKVYIHGNNIEVINDNSSMKLINASKKEVKEEKVEVLDLNISPIETNKSKNTLSFKDTFKDAIHAKYKKKKTKAILMVFMIISFIFTGSIPFLSNINATQFENVVETNRNVYNPQDNVDIAKLSESLQDDDLLLSKYNTYLTKLYVPTSLQVSAPYLNASYVPKLEGYKFIKGEESDNIFDIYIDEIIANRLIERIDFKQFGITSYDALINQEVVYFDDNSMRGKIAGIVRTHEPSIYADARLLSTNENVFDVNHTFLYEGSVKNLNDFEYLVNTKYKDEETDLNVVGTFTSKYNIRYLANTKTANKDFIENDRNIKLYTQSPSYYEEKLSTTFGNDYNREKEQFNVENNGAIIMSIIIVLITIGVSFLLLWFYMVINLNSNIREISVKRSIGVKKKDIYKIFISDVIVIMLKYSLPAYLLASTLIMYLHFGGWVPNLNLLFIPLGFIVFFVLGIIIALIPVMRLLRKSPSEINRSVNK